MTYESTQPTRETKFLDKGTFCHYDNDNDRGLFQLIGGEEVRYPSRMRKNITEDLNDGKRVWKMENLVKC